MKRMMMATVLVTTLTTFGSSAFADWQVCNSSATDLWVAIGWRTEANAIRSAGWWKVSGCGCKKVVTGVLFGTEVFLLGKRVDTGEFVVNGGPTLLCSKPTDAFHFNNERGNARVCSTSEAHNVGAFQTFSFQDGNDVTTRMHPPRKPTDKVCID